MQTMSSKWWHNEAYYVQYTIHFYSRFAVFLVTKCFFVLAKAKKPLSAGSQTFNLTLQNG